MAFWIASFVCLLAMNVTVRQSEQRTLGLLFGFGLLVGPATTEPRTTRRSSAQQGIGHDDEAR
jgi:hypothetical protein